MENETETQNVSPENQNESLVSMSINDTLDRPILIDRLDFSVNCDVLKQFVEELAVLSDEAHIKVDPVEGLIVRLVDPAHIAMVQTGIAIELFDAWQMVPHNAYVGSFGMDLDKMHKYLKSLKLKDTVLDVSVDMVNRKMVIKSPKGIREMTTLDLSQMSEPKIPELYLPTQFEVRNQKEFVRALKEAREISNHIAIEFNSETSQIWLVSEGDMDKIRTPIDICVIDWGYSTISKRNALTEQYENVQTRDSRSLFPLEYLENIAKVIPGAFKVDLGNDFPVRISYGKTVYLLAPRIESSD